MKFYVIKDKVYVMSEWISVKDRMPNVGEYVLVADWYSGINYGMVKAYYNSLWFIDEDSLDVWGDSKVDLGFDPTHWMPLPEPPK